MIKNIIFTVILLFSVTLLISSCNSLVRSDEVRTIDSLIMVNDSVALALLEIDTLKLLDAREVFARNWVTIKLLVDSLEDTKDLREDSLWQYIVTYSATDRSVKKLYKRYNRLMETQQENLHQLQTLRQSAKRDKIPSDSLIMFIAEEAMAVYNTQHEVMMYMPELKRTVLALDSMHQYVDKTVEHLRDIKTKP